MPAWGDLLEEFNAQPQPEKALWINRKLQESLNGISGCRDGRNVIFYASAFLQKPQAPANRLQISQEDINGFMSVLYGMDFEKGLTLLLHTPGGLPNAADTLVAYLRSKFPSNLEAIVPVYAMSAGTMIALACDRIVMGRQSQLGPIDPQLMIPTSGRPFSAQAIIEQFEAAKNDISQDISLAHAWAPILQSLGPALLKEAQNARDYGEKMVARWLAKYMFSGHEDPDGRAEATAKYFSDAAEHMSHGRRIDRDEARAQNVVVHDLEDDQPLQEATLTAYHVATLLFEQGPATKFVFGNNGRAVVKNWQSPVVAPSQT